MGRDLSCSANCPSSEPVTATDGVHMTAADPARRALPIGSRLRGSASRQTRSVLDLLELGGTKHGIRDVH